MRYLYLFIQSNQMSNPLQIYLHEGIYNPLFHLDHGGCDDEKQQVTKYNLICQQNTRNYNAEFFHHVLKVLYTCRY